MEPRISVIVPVYNSELYLRACVESILSQTYPNLEILLVNDGSTDRSLEILEAYAKEDKRMIVIDQPHEGVCAARNAALTKATGDYIGFVDSDDIVDKVLYQRLLDNMIAYHADVSVCGFYFCYENDRCVRSAVRGDIHVYARKDAIANAVAGKPYAGHLWDKLFKASLFGEECFDPELTIYEDLHMFIRLMQRVNSLVFNPEPLYYYLQRTESVYARADAAALTNMRKACLKLSELLKPEYPQLVSFINTSRIQYSLLFLERTATAKTPEVNELRADACRDIRAYWNAGFRKRIPGHDGWLALAAFMGPNTHCAALSVFQSLQRLRKMIRK